MEWIKTGDSRFQWQMPGESVDQKKVVLVEQGMENMIGMTEEKIKPITIHGRKVIKREQILDSKVMGNRQDITIVERESFKPVSYFSYTDDLQIEAMYQNHQVLIRKGTEKKTIQLNNQGCFDSFSVEMLLRILPLQTGHTFRLHAFHAHAEQEMMIQIEVEGKEEVTAGKNNLSTAWKVKTCFGTKPQYYWIDGMTREILKQAASVGKGVHLEFRRW